MGRHFSALPQHLLQKIDAEPKMDLRPIHAVLGEQNTPILEPTRVSRFRLIRALQAKYGPAFKALPGVQHAINHFDSESSYFQKLKKVRMG